MLFKEVVAEFSDLVIFQKRHLLSKNSIIHICKYITLARKVQILYTQNSDAIFEISDRLPGVVGRFAAVLKIFRTGILEFHITAVNTDIPVAGSVAQFSLGRSALIVAVEPV